MSVALDKFSRLAALKPAHFTPARPATLRTPDEEDAVGRLLGAGVARNHFGEHLAIRNWFSTPEFSEPSPVALKLLSPTRHESPYIRTRNGPTSLQTRGALEDPQKWLFLDTETTGLAGGTGTYAFLVGLAWWDAGGLQVEQFLMRDFVEEHSLLHELSNRIAERPVLVTFNGKSFDWPLLESRFTMTRSIAVPKLAAHLDLLHPARALWKLRLGSVRLVELERHVLNSNRLGWHREDDISSAMIPQFYFDYLRGGPAAPIAGIVRHNQMDLRGLAALFGKINAMLSETCIAPNEMRSAAEGERGAADDNSSTTNVSHGAANAHRGTANENRGAEEIIDSLDLFGLSRFLQRRGESERAHSACVQAIDAGLPAEFRPRACRELALIAKRRGEHARAAEIWLEIVGDPCDGVFACEQLAIHYERQAKDLNRAVEFARLAIAKIQRQRENSVGNRRDPYVVKRSARLEQKFLQRVGRLQQRMKTAGDATRTPLLTRSHGA